MPAHRLNHPADRTATIVETALTGAPSATTAAEAGVSPADLDAAIQTYRTAGRAALHHAHDTAWFQARITPADWNNAAAAFHQQVAPILDDLEGGHAAWWFLRKHPHWRLRIRTSDHRAAASALDRLAHAGVIAAWERGTIYEPELAAFGGPTAMDIVHYLFCADSRGILAYTAVDPPPIGRREVSILLIRALQDHAGLDWYEAADIFDRVAAMRPEPPAADTARIDKLAEQMRPLLAMPAKARSELFAHGGPLTRAANWLTAYITAGQQLAAAAEGDRLGRGLRATIAHIVIFNWNRLDLAAHTQGILARAATAAILPRS